VTADVETVVVGAGAVGLATARALAIAGQEVMILERHDAIGTETSSRNSEVVHGGLYYPTGSNRAKFCVRGRDMLYAFAAEHGVGIRKCGKLLVATSDAELGRLAAIRDTAGANGVSDLVELSADDAKVLEPEVNCVAAMLSPSTGIVSSHEFMQALEGDFLSRGGQLVLNTSVDAIETTPSGDFVLTTSGPEGTYDLTCQRLVIAAGLSATRLGRMLGYRSGYEVPETYPAKGHYFSLASKAPFSRLIYPMPSGAWLGIHLTLDLAGRAKFGPDIEWKDSVDYSFEDPDGARMKLFENEIRRYWPGLPNSALYPDYVGVRPKIYPEGAPVADFALHGPELTGIDNLVALYGIESPGLTSSLAIGEAVAEKLLPGSRPV
jgi:L-2-hydroxyglutarate oxidase LhgO